jgi:hypothetical protein
LKKGKNIFNISKENKGINFEENIGNDITYFISKDKNITNKKLDNYKDISEKIAEKIHR